MANSILDTIKGECYLCYRTCQTHKHHIYGGANRSISEEYGFFVYLCPECHRMVHAEGEYARMFLKKPCEIEYEKTHEPEDFFKLIGRYYT